MASPDWGTGLPAGILSEIIKAGGCEAMKAVRAVSKEWKEEFESNVTAISIGTAGPTLPTDGSLSGRFPNLAKLDLSHCCMPESELTILGSLRKLISLNLGVSRVPFKAAVAQARENSIAAPAVFPFRREQLYLGLSDVGMEHLRGLPLTKLNLNECRKESNSWNSMFDHRHRSHPEAGFSCIRGMPLTSLSMEGMDPTDAILGCLEGLPLSELMMGDYSGGGSNDVTDLGLQNLRGMPLTRLDLSYNGEKVTDGGLEVLHGMPLTDLNLANCHSIRTLEMLRGMSLRRLVLAHVQVPPSEFEVLRGMPLARLDLAGVPMIDDDLAFLRGMSIVAFNLSYCEGLTLAGFLYLEGLPIETLCMYTYMDGGRELLEGVLGMRGSVLPADLVVISDEGEAQDFV